MRRCTNASKASMMLFLPKIMPMPNCIKTTERSVNLQRANKLYQLFQAVTLFYLGIYREGDNAWQTRRCKQSGNLYR